MKYKLINSKKEDTASFLNAFEKKGWVLKDNHEVKDRKGILYDQLTFEASDDKEDVKPWDLVNKSEEEYRLEIANKESSDRENIKYYVFFKTLGAVLTFAGYMGAIVAAYKNNNNSIRLNVIMWVLIVLGTIGFVMLLAARVIAKKLDKE